MTMTTIAKTRWEKTLANVTEIKIFTLDNGFCGETRAVIGSEFISNLRKFDAKVRWNKETGFAVARFHSNWWYEFKV